jgi:hypothetical protein
MTRGQCRCFERNGISGFRFVWSLPRPLPRHRSASRTTDQVRFSIHLSRSTTEHLIEKNVHSLIICDAIFPCSAAYGGLRCERRKSRTRIWSFVGFTPPPYQQTVDTTAKRIEANALDRGMEDLQLCWGLPI